MTLLLVWWNWRPWSVLTHRRGRYRAWMLNGGRVMRPHPRVWHIGLDRGRGVFRRIG